MAVRSGWGDPRRGTAEERGYGWAWKKLRRVVLARDKGLCQPCKRKRRATAATQVDHKIPKSQGGTDDEGNLQGICDDCHTVKTAEEALGDGVAKIRINIGKDGWPA